MGRGATWERRRPRRHPGFPNTEARRIQGKLCDGMVRVGSRIGQKDQSIGVFRSYAWRSRRKALRAWERGCPRRHPGFPNTEARRIQRKLCDGMVRVSFLIGEKDQSMWVLHSHAWRPRRKPREGEERPGVRLQRVAPASCRCRSEGATHSGRAVALNAGI